VLAHVFERVGLTTVGVAFIREHVERMQPPRMLWVPFPFGYAMGKPNDVALQHRVLAAAFDLLQRPAGPVLEEFPDEEPEPSLLQASAIARQPVEKPVDAADEVTRLRAYYERWLEAHEGRTAVGLCGIPQRRWRGLIRFLQAYAGGEEVDFKDRPAEVSLPQFMRYCVDDLKAFYYEARMTQRPGISATDLHTWFWGETALGQLIPMLTERMNASEDPLVKAVAYGLSR
jgi:hypothetical protein